MGLFRVPRHRKWWAKNEIRYVECIYWFQIAPPIYTHPLSGPRAERWETEGFSKTPVAVGLRWQSLGQGGTAGGGNPGTHPPCASLRGGRMSSQRQPKPPRFVLTLRDGLRPPRSSYGGPEDKQQFHCHHLLLPKLPAPKYFAAELTRSHLPHLIYALSHLRMAHTTPCARSPTRTGETEAQKHPPTATWKSCVKGRAPEVSPQHLVVAQRCS